VAKQDDNSTSDFDRLELIHLMGLMKGDIPPDALEKIEKELFGITFQQAFERGYTPKYAVEDDGGNLVTVHSFGENIPTPGLRPISRDEAQLQHIPQQLKTAAIQSLRDAQDQPHLPYQLYCNFARSPESISELPGEVGSALAGMLPWIERCSTAWLCPGCGKVISLHCTPEGMDENEFVRALILTAGSVNLTCPMCQDGRFIFLKSSALLSGLPLEHFIPSELNKPKPTVSNKTESVPKKSETFLESLLRTQYGQLHDTQPLSLDWSKDTVKHTAEQWQRLPKGESGPSPPAEYWESFKERGSHRQSLTPDKNVLYRIHDSVMLMVMDCYPQFKEIPVAIAKDPMLRGRLFYNAQGDMAIIFSMGYFSELYTFNKITHRALHNPTIDSLDTIWSLLLILLGYISHFIGKQTAQLKSLRQDDDLPYKDTDEFWRIHLITNAQQQFVLLHEFGHAAQLLRHEVARHQVVEWESDLARDIDADAWAAHYIAEKGDDFYIPWMQLRSIFWLFEYYNMIEVFEGKKRGHEFTARPRFDKIYEIIDPRHTLLSLEYIKDVRWTFDYFLANLDTLFDEH
jgi:hypothetical protein